MPKKDTTKKVILIISLVIAVALLMLAVILIVNKKAPYGEVNKIYCSSQSRNVDVCTEIYAPVCGYPAGQTFSNACFACMNQGIEYYTQGTCA